MVRFTAQCSGTVNLMLQSKINLCISLHVFIKTDKTIASLRLLLLDSFLFCYQRGYYNSAIYGLYKGSAKSLPALFPTRAEGHS